MPAGYGSMTDSQSAGNLKTDEDSDNAPDSDDGGGDEQDETMAGQDLMKAMEAGDPHEVYLAWKHCYRVCQAHEQAGGGDSGGEGEGGKGKSALVVAIGKARPPKKG